MKMGTVYPQILNGTITVLIADDHPIVRAGLRMMIDRADDIRIVAEAGDGRTALEAIEQKTPSVSVLDIEMPNLTGLDVLSEIRKKSLDTRAIVLTLHDDRDIFQRAIELGAVGYIVKDSAPHDIVRGIRRVAGGEHFMGSLSAENAKRKFDPHSGELLAVSSLTAAERRVLQMIADNKSTKEIAEENYISPRTVDSHRSNICSKLGISGSFALIRFAIEHRRFI
jgi:DNA-binding NarL/FixJ family response regulator